MKYHLPFGIGPALVLGSCLGLTGCTDTSEVEPAKGPPTVTVSYPIQRVLTEYQSYTGRTAAVDPVQIRARVSGYLEKINFKEGAEVKQGDVLYEIDQRPYKIALRQAQAQVPLYEAQIKYNDAVYRRNIRLLDSGQAVGVEQAQQSLAQRDTNQAQLEGARANVDQAQLNLDWTKVQAPIAGQTSRTLVNLGNLVNADQTVLTTLVSQDPIYAYFDVDEPTVLQIRELVRQGAFGPAGMTIGKIPVRLRLANEKGFPHEGILDFVNNQLDQATATLSLRATIPNPKPANGPRVFTPNLFVRVRVPTSPLYQALLMNAEAVGTDQDLKYLYAVDEDDKVVRHAVQLGSLHDGLQSITEGLKPGERVIVNGLQRVHPGVTVNPRLVPMPAPTIGGGE